MKPKGEECEHCGMTDMHETQACIGWSLDMLMYGTASVYLFTEQAPDEGAGEPK